MGRGRRQGSAAAEEEDTDSISSHTTAARGEEGGMGKGRDVTKSRAIKCDGGGVFRRREEGDWWETVKAEGFLAAANKIISRKGERREGTFSHRPPFLFFPKEFFFF